jgi:chaperone required for assembly of F1-ATPase
MAYAARLMKRFYEQAAVAVADDGFAITLDGKPVRTPARAPLVVPVEALAKAIAEEWSAQGDKVDPRTMRITGLANAAIDRVGPDHAGFVRGLAVFGETDLLCYRAEGPPSLVARQARHWDPLLDWARRRFDARFEVITGIMHRYQPEQTVDRLRDAVAARDSFALAGLSPLVTISGSLVIALALTEGAADLESAWSAAIVDESWQAENWGEDAEAARTLDLRRQEFDAAYRFLTLLAD